MSLREALQLFKEGVVGGTINAPDNYRDWDTGGYRAHRENLMHYWNEAKPMIKRDLDKVAIIDEKLLQALDEVKTVHLAGHWSGLPGAPRR
jgi:hypothetical protein